MLYKEELERNVSPDKEDVDFLSYI